MDSRHSLNGVDKRTTPTVSAVVVTWNSERDIADCLSSLLSQHHPVETIFVVDNNSTDKTAEIIRTRFPAVELIAEPVNHGFAKGNNIAFNRCGSEWIIALNPDAQLEPDWLSKLLAYADTDLKIGMLGGLLLGKTDGEPVIDSLGIEIFESRRVQDSLMGQPAIIIPTEPFAVFGVCAAAVLYRREALLDCAIDGETFPERFFSYYEDADLSWRMWRRGWKAVIVPSAVGYHKRGGSPIGSGYSRKLVHRNRLWMIARNEPLTNLFRHPLPVLLHSFLMCLRMIRYPYLIGAQWDALMGLLWASRCRKALPSICNIAPPFKAGTGFSRKRISQTITKGK